LVELGLEANMASPPPPYVLTLIPNPIPTTHPALTPAPVAVGQPGAGGAASCRRYWWCRPCGGSAGTPPWSSTSSLTTTATSVRPTPPPAARNGRVGNTQGWSWWWPWPLLPPPPPPHPHPSPLLTDVRRQDGRQRSLSKRHGHKHGFDPVITCDFTFDFVLSGCEKWEDGETPVVVGGGGGGGPPPFLC